MHKSCVLLGSLAVLFVFFSGFSSNACAAVADSCKKDADLFCASIVNPSELQQCLLEHIRELRPACKEEIGRMLEAKRGAFSRGGGALTSFGGLNSFGPPLPVISYEGRIDPRSNNPSFNENKVSVSVPVYRADKDTVAVSATAGMLHFDDDLSLDSGSAVPNNLYRYEIGGQYFHQLPDQKTWGVRASVGYAGDEPSRTLQDASYSLSATYGFPAKNKNYWILMVFMANNSAFVNYVPIPGFAYIYHSSTVNGLFGFPLNSFQWSLSPDWTYSFSLFGVNLQSEISYGTADHVQPFFGFQWNHSSYIPSYRTDSKDRLTLAEEKLGVGVRSLLGDSFLAEINGGRELGRSIYLGDGLTNHDGGYLILGASWYAGLSLKALF
jgi:hypothetical protein